MRLLSLAPPFRGSLHAGGGREGGRRGRSREGGWRTEGGDAGGAAEEGRTCCRGGSSRGPPSCRAGVPQLDSPDTRTQPCSQLEAVPKSPNSLGCWGLLPRVRGTQDHSQEKGHPVTPAFLGHPSCASLPWPQPAAGECLEPTDQILLPSPIPHGPAPPWTGQIHSHIQLWPREHLTWVNVIPFCLFPTVLSPRPLLPHTVGYLRKPRG